MQKVSRNLIEDLKAGRLKPEPAPQSADEQTLEPEEKKVIQNEVEQEQSVPAKKPERTLPPYVGWDAIHQRFVISFKAMKEEDPSLLTVYGAQPPQLHQQNAHIKRFTTVPAEDGLDVDTDEAKKWRKNAHEEFFLGLFLPMFVGTPVLFMVLQGIVPTTEDLAEYRDLCARTPKNQRAPEFKTKSLDSNWPAYFISSQFLLLYYRACERHMLGQIDAQIGGLPEGKQKEQLISTMVRMRESASLMAKEVSKRRREATHRAINVLFAAYQCNMPYDVQRSRTTEQWVAEHREILLKLAHELRLLTILQLRFTEACVCQLLFGNSRSKESIALLRVPDDGVITPNDISTKVAKTYNAKLHYQQLFNVGTFWKDTNPKYPSGAPAFAHREGSFIMEQLLGPNEAKPIPMEESPVFKAMMTCTADEIGDGTTSLAFLWWRMCITVRELRAIREIEREKELVRLAADEDPHPLPAVIPIHSTASV
jgi:hypothetical protein